LRTKRYSEAAISQMMEKTDDYAPLCISLEDKFGKYGIISCIIIERVDNIAFIDTWVMSCRVLKRGVENVVFNTICNTARKWNCDWVVGEYIPTKKNQMVNRLYPELGFEPTPEGWFSRAEGSVYRMNLSSAVQKNHCITIDG
jgi:FkbH-like protein